MKLIHRDPLCGEHALTKLVCYQTTTQEKDLSEKVKYGRITELIKNKKLFNDLNIPLLNPDSDRVMICGSLPVVKDIGDILAEYNMSHSSGRQLKEYAYERAFVG